MAILVSGKNKEGYIFALEKVASFFKLLPPVKSALSQYRKKISYLFFKNIFYIIVRQFMPTMKRYKDYHIVGIDGDEFNLPPTNDILKEGYKGYPVGEDEETHYLKMYVVKCVDLMSNVVLNFKNSHFNDEIHFAIEMLHELPKKTIAIFDRLYLSKKLIEAHAQNGIIFLARCKTGSTFSEIVEFYKSNKRRSFFLYNGIKINLIKKINATGKVIILATNLDISDWTNKELENLYTLRWDTESNNRDMTCTLQIEQWHSKFFNGIMQEIYVNLIMMNITKITIYSEGGYKINLEKNETIKSNFKFMFTIITDLLPNLINNEIKKHIKKIRYHISKTIEKRFRLVRSYPRVIKKRGKTYKNATLVQRRP